MKMVSPDGSEHTDRQSIADAFADFYAQLYAEPPPSATDPIPNSTRIQEQEQQEPISEITEEEIQQDSSLQKQDSASHAGAQLASQKNIRCFEEDLEVAA